MEVGLLAFKLYISIVFEKVWPPHVYAEYWMCTHLFLCLFILYYLPAL